MNNSVFARADRCLGPGGKVADVPGAAPRRAVLKSDIEAIEGAGKVQKIKMRYVVVSYNAC